MDIRKQWRQWRLATRAGIADLVLVISFLLVLLAASFEGVFSFLALLWASAAIGAGALNPTFDNSLRKESQRKEDIAFDIAKGMKEHYGVIVSESSVREALESKGKSRNRSSEKPLWVEFDKKNRRIILSTDSKELPKVMQ